MLSTVQTIITCDHCGCEAPATDKYGNAVPGSHDWFDVKWNPFMWNYDEYGGSDSGHLCPTCIHTLCEFFKKKKPEREHE